MWTHLLFRKSKTVPLFFLFYNNREQSKITQRDKAHYFIKTCTLLFFLTNFYIYKKLSKAIQLVSNLPYINVSHLRFSVFYYMFSICLRYKNVLKVLFFFFILNRILLSIFLKGILWTKYFKCIYLKMLLPFRNKRVKKRVETIWFLKSFQTNSFCKHSFILLEFRTFYFYK